MKGKLDKTKNCENKHEFQEAVADFEERFDFGYIVFSLNFNDRDDLIKKVAYYFIYSQQFEELQDFLKGLSCNGVLEVLKKYPDDAKKLFAARKVCPDSLKNAFEFEFNTNSKKAQLEEDIIYNLKTFTDKIHEKKVKTVRALTLIDLEDDNVEASNMKERLITLKDISMFLAGSTYLPDKISLTFDHDDTKKRISASTCFNEMTIPVAERYFDLNFSENFLHDIVNSPGFGNV